MQKQILVVDDDPHARKMVRFAVQQAGMDTIEASNGKQAINRFIYKTPDLIVLDVNMPEMDGLDVCREVRKLSNVPILFLSARCDEIDRIIAFELGADDYVAKPCNPRELIARIKAILKRCNKQRNNPDAHHFKVGDLSLNLINHQALWQSREVLLTATEFSILETMIRHPHMVFSRRQIMNTAYNGNIFVSDRTIDSHIRHIRHKFAKRDCHSIFITIHGVGYKLFQ